MKKWIWLFIIVGISVSLQPLHAQKWEKTKRLTWTDRNSGGAAITQDINQNLHLVWSDNTLDDNFELYYKKSTDGGTTWGAGKRLTWSPGYSLYSSIGTDSSNNIHLVWNCDSAGINDDIYYKRSTDGGTTWSSTKRLTWSSGISLRPKIAIDSSDVIYVVFYDDTPGNDEIFCLRSKDGGDTWLKNKRITWNAGASLDPAIAIDSSDCIHLVWSDKTPGNHEIYYMMSSDDGGSWINNRRVTWSSDYSGNPGIALDSGGAIHVVFNDITLGPAEIYHKKSTDGGVSWSGKRLTWNSGASSRPEISVDQKKNIHIVWIDSTPGNWEIYYARSQDGGQTWPKRRITWNAGHSDNPCIIVQDLSYDIHVFWSNSIAIQYEIYYKKGIQ
jgi:hypothetical protein